MLAPVISSLDEIYCSFSNTRFTHSPLLLTDIHFRQLSLPNDSTNLEKCLSVSRDITNLMAKREVAKNMSDTLSYLPWYQSTYLYFREYFEKPLKCFEKPLKNNKYFENPLKYGKARQPSFQQGGKQDLSKHSAVPVPFVLFKPK